jgi:hypothetical protein
MAASSRRTGATRTSTSSTLPLESVGGGASVSSGTCREKPPRGATASLVTTTHGVSAAHGRRSPSA